MADTTRKRGLWLLLLALVLLALLVGVLAGTRPDIGAYPGWLHALVHALWIAATASFGFGTFHAIVGAPGVGVFRGMRTPVGLLVGGGSMLALAVGAFLLHLTLSFERSEETDRESHSDWDWD